MFTSRRNPFATGTKAARPSKRLSDPIAMIIPMAWTLIERLQEWRVDWVHAGVRGLTLFVDRRILVRHGLRADEERCVLAHEAHHALRGPSPRWMHAREEEAVSRAAARYLINIRDLGEALAWSLNMAEAAEELHVDEPTLRARLRGLHPAERAYLRKRLEHHHDHC